MPESQKPSAINRSKSAAAGPGDVAAEHNGEATPDPYRWLERAAGPGTTAWVAALQAAQQSDAPILLRVETSAGHSSAGKPTAKAADRLTFLERALGLTPL